VLDLQPYVSALRGRLLQFTRLLSEGGNPPPQAKDKPMKIVTDESQKLKKLKAMIADGGNETMRYSAPPDLNHC
jgi:small-conductance mechanosensitive channel